MNGARLTSFAIANVSQLRSTPVDRQRAKNALCLLVGWLFLFFCFFPYLEIVPFPTDIQPYALVLSIFVCGLATLPRPSWPVSLLAIAPIAAFLVWLADDQSFFGFRESLSFLSPLTISMATMIILRSSDGARTIKALVILAAYCWLFAGLAEKLIDPNLMGALIPKTNTDLSRGVTGLATEPSFYGEYCIYLLLFNYLCNGNNKSIVMILLFQIFFLAQSGVTILLLLFLPAYWFFLFPRPSIIFGVLSFLILTALMFVYLLPQVQGLRVAYLAANLLAHPLDLSRIDVSVNARIGHILFSILGFIDNHGIPIGFDHFNTYVALKADKVNFVWLGGLSPHMKIISGYGAGLFELGVFGLAIPLAGLVACLNYFRPEIRKGLVFGCFLTTIMFSGNPVSLPLFGLFLGYLMARPQGSSALPKYAELRPHS